MLTLKVPLKKAEFVKRFLINKRLFNKNYAIVKDDKFIYFPVTNKNGLKKSFPFVIFINKKSKKFKNLSPREALQRILSKRELQLLGTSFDIVGKILILELPRELTKKEKQVAKAFLNFKNIKTIVKKQGPHTGDLRLQKYKVLAGIRNKETIHKENNVRIKLNIEKMYFSPRLATERLRIAKQVKPGEEVIVMFSGCCPYVLVIAKNSKPKLVYGIEINKKAHAYALENMKLNKLGNVKLFNGDVRNVLPKLNKKFDRIVMPLPKTGENFLSLTLKFIKNKGVIHFYDFSKEEDFPEATIKKIRCVCGKMNKSFKILKCVKCGQYAPKEFRICVDFVVD